MPDLNYTDKDLYNLQCENAARFPGLNLYACFLPSLFNSSEFKIKECEEVKDGDLALVRIKFTYEPGNAKSNIIVRGGELFLMKDHYFMIKKGYYETVFPNQKEMPRTKIENTYEFNDKIPLLLSKKESTTGAGINHYTKDIKYTLNTTPSFNEKSFKVSRFNIPEPGIAQNTSAQGNNFRFIIIISAIVLIVISIVFIKIKSNQ